MHLKNAKIQLDPSDPVFPVFHDIEVENVALPGAKSVHLTYKQLEDYLRNQEQRRPPPKKANVDRNSKAGPAPTKKKEAAAAKPPTGKKKKRVIASSDEEADEGDVAVETSQKPAPRKKAGKTIAVPDLESDEDDEPQIIDDEDADEAISEGEMDDHLSQIPETVYGEDEEELPPIISQSRVPGTPRAKAGPSRPPTPPRKTTRRARTTFIK